MPALTATDIVILVVLTIVGAVAGWLVRDRRAAREKEAVRATWQEEIDRQRKEQGRLADQNKDLMEQVSQAQVYHAKQKDEVADLTTAVSDANARSDEMQQEVDSRDARVKSLKRELRNWQERLPPLIDRYRQRNEEAERLEAELQEARATISKLEEAPDEASGRAASVEPLRDAGPFTDGLEASNDEEDEYVDEIDDDIDDEATPVLLDESVMIEYEVPAEESETDAGEAVDEPVPDDAGDLPQQRDNLKKIKGVGPAIEKALNEMGFFSFRQIAEMSDYDVDRVARRLKGFHSRIQREDWIGQAQMLLDKTALA